MRIRQLFLTILALSSSLSFINQATVFALYLSSGEIEALQAEATLHYHSSQYDKSLEILRKILDNTRSGSKQQISALETTALCYRRMKNDAQAAGSYRKLIELSKSDAKAAPYHFELATIRYQQKNHHEAYEHFIVSAKEGFNDGTSRFFLGLLELEMKKTRKALYSFAKALNEPDANTVKPATRFYLGTTYLQLGKTESAIRSFQETIESTKVSGIEKDPITENSAEGSKKTLAALDKSQTFVSATMLTQLDSNVQAYPKDVMNSVGTSGRESLKTILTGTITHSTSPVKKWQYNPMYSIYGNYNYNKNTRDLNFLTHTLGGYVFHEPYKIFSTGFKAQSVFSFKNTPPKTGATLYTKFSLTHEVGPLVKYEMTPRTFLTSELYWKPKKYYNDPTTGKDRRTGHGFIMKHTVDFISSYDLWNPSGYFSFEMDIPKGDNFKASMFGIGLSNKMSLFKDLTISESIDYMYTNFTKSTPRRTDKYISARLLISSPISSRWSLIVDGNYISNKSSVPTSYTYTRWTSSFGVTYTL